MKQNQQEVGLTAVAYFRVSSDRQEKEGYSIPAQQKLIREYSNHRKIKIVREFVESETAKKAGRQQFDEMVAFLGKNRSCRIILVEKTDRLYRNFKDYVTLDELSVVIHFVKEGVILSDESKSSEKFIHGIKVLMAKNYIDNLSEETRKGMDEKAEQGDYPTRAPLGYSNVEGPDRKRIIVPEPKNAPLIKNLFEWYASGKFSLDELAAKAHEAGFIFRKSRKPVSRAVIHTILRNRMYTGRFLWRGKLYQGRYEPLISDEIWQKVQVVLTTRGKKKTRFVRHDFAFSKLISCGHCGCALVGELKKKKYVYYHCTGYKGKCPEPFTREEVLSDQFTNVLRRLVLDDEVISLVSDALRQSHVDIRKFQEEAISRLQAEYTKLQNRIDTIYTDKLDGVITGEFFARKSQEWRAEQDDLLKQIARHQDANQTYLEEGVQLLELAKRAAELFQKQAPKEQRRLLDFVLSNCTWANDVLKVEFRKPFDMLAVAVEGLERGAVVKGTSVSDHPGKLPG